ncbi:helix-turn-helix transcriptional regulator [Cellulophaga baltica]|uniref:helix-turn-helix transcriptional regulator n=1 Tax=Cellulophaga TaxID=104264 RepID=UPI001C069D45|nr:MULTISPECIES: helix-turn-helix transcriptional regulator [Cellulophaga]MBU2996181.1 helix-turn-helix transcriptional regulator [Cellulophaga baltica]MDO6767576.1 helix-turn-helix transcriptional regulator [Cellulophaga sp. 1_MG-2023]
MINPEEFINRIEKILDFYSLTATSFADKISVQRSSISHLLSGRNKPSLEFVLKVEDAFPEIQLNWLLHGKGSFPASKEKKVKQEKNVTFTTPVKQTEATKTPQVIEKKIAENHSITKDIKKVILFYTDGSFEAYDN